MENKKSNFLLADMSFPILVGMACAAIFAGTHMFVVHGVGAFNEIFTVKLLE